jgi:selenocysteine-specific elongation factor
MNPSAPKRAAILGTAGHIDHGKTALVERLTGTNTDRLPEEKARGISIELGFAALDLPSGRRVSVVDVPGHERFVKQMLAGAGGMDLVMLVIAADEGIMPQTREHLDIVSLLGISDGFVALTKADLAPDREWLDMVEADIEEAVEGTCFAGRPIVRCSARTGEGVDRIRSVIDERLDHARYAERGRETRLPIDRVFVMQGFGTVVTGTLWSGTLAPGDAVRILPSDLETRVKSVQVHGGEVQEAVAGQRVAVSLHRVDRDRVARGEWVVKSDVLRAASMMDAWFRLLPGAPKPLKTRARVRVHLGSAELLARLILLDRDDLEPGAVAPVQLRLESPGVAEAGDRYVVRSYSPMHTIGGGTILVSNAAKRRRHRGDVSAEFRRLEEGTPEDRMIEALERAGMDGIAAKDLRSALGLAAGEFEALAGAGRASGRVLGDARLFGAAIVDRAMREIEAALTGHLAAHPFRWGVAIGELKSRVGRMMDAALFDIARARLVSEGRAQERREQIAPAGRPRELPPEGESLAGQLEEKLAAGGFAVLELAKALDEMRVPHGDDLVARLLFEGRLTQVSQEFVYPTGRIEEARVRLSKHFESHETLSVADAKELLGGISRKHIVPLLEFFDRQGWTRRAGDARVKAAGLGA